MEIFNTCLFIKYYDNNKYRIIERSNANYNIHYNDNKKAILLQERQKYKQQRKCKVSLIYNLPCDVQNKIYNMKHQIEFSPSLNYIEKIKYCYSRNIWLDLSYYRQIKNM